MQSHRFPLLQAHDQSRAECTSRAGNAGITTASSAAYNQSILVCNICLILVLTAYFLKYTALPQ